MPVAVELEAIAATEPSPAMAPMPINAVGDEIKLTADTRELPGPNGSDPIKLAGGMPYSTEAICADATQIFPSARAFTRVTLFAISGREQLPIEI